MWVSFIFGAGVMILNMVAKNIFPPVLQSPINAGAFAMIAGLIIVPIVSLISPRMASDKVEEKFKCFEEKVMVRKSKALEE